MTHRELIEAHLPLVRAVATGVKRAVPFADMDDIVAYGTIGLIRSAQRYREGTGATFATFAHHRIRGAMLDGICLMSGGKRGTHGLLERVGEFHLDAVATDVEAADDFLEHRDDARALREAIAALPERERALVEAVDLRGRRLEDAGADLGITKSWASRLRKEALQVVRARLEGRDFS